MDYLLIESLRSSISGLHKTLRKSFTDGNSFSLTELETIGLIYRHERILPSELAAKTKITTPSMSQILKKMEKMEMINRTPSKEDGRKVYISLSEQGQQIVDKAKYRKDEMLKHLLESKLTVDELHVLEQAIPILKKLNT
ncbi:MAG: MarR family transcriptional regulator [Thalassobius sp.]|nr:MarR family transcriptional regulator [Thalassovita sp.]